MQANISAFHYSTHRKRKQAIREKISHLLHNADEHRGPIKNKKSSITDQIILSEKKTPIAIDKTVILWYNYLIKLV